FLSTTTRTRPNGVPLSDGRPAAVISAAGREGHVRICFPAPRPAAAHSPKTVQLHLSITAADVVSSSHQSRLARRTLYQTNKHAASTAAMAAQSRASVVEKAVLPGCSSDESSSGGGADPATVRAGTTGLGASDPTVAGRDRAGVRVGAGAGGAAPGGTAAPGGEAAAPGGGAGTTATGSDAGGTTSSGPVLLPVAGRQEEGMPGRRAGRVLLLLLLGERRPEEREQNEKMQQQSAGQEAGAAAAEAASQTRRWRVHFRWNNFG
ncbi:MAG: hypothetical protein BJ554DRAFT_7045, partial [Olpidium bornovanus]